MIKTFIHEQKLFKKNPFDKMVCALIVMSRICKHWQIWFNGKDFSDSTVTLNFPCVLTSPSCPCALCWPAQGLHRGPSALQRSPCKPEWTRPAGLHDLAPHLGVIHTQGQTHVSGHRLRNGSNDVHLSETNSRKEKLAVNWMKADLNVI